MGPGRRAYPHALGTIATRYFCITLSYRPVPIPIMLGGDDKWMERRRYPAGWNESARAIAQASRKRGSLVPSINSPGRSDG